MSSGPELAAVLSQVTTFQAVFESVPWAMFWKDRESVYRGANRACAAVAGLRGPDEMVGRRDEDLLWYERAAEYRADDVEVMTSGQPKMEVLEVFPVEGGEVWIEKNKLPLRDASGEVIGLVGWFADVTARKLAEEAEARAQLEAVQEMATPLLPVADGVLVMPLIGKIDRQRAAQMIEALLAGVVAHRAHTAILDVTGVHRMDANAVEALAKAAAGARLLGAEVVVTGVGSAVAQAIVGFGVSLGGVVLGDLKAGVAYALGQRR